MGIYVGSGIHQWDVLEGTMARSAQRLHDALDAAGVPHFYWNYGRPGPSSPHGCDGGHSFSCWNFALDHALPRIVAVLEAPTAYPAGAFRSRSEVDCPPQIAT